MHFSLKKPHRQSNTQYKHKWTHHVSSITVLMVFCRINSIRRHHEKNIHPLHKSLSFFPSDIQPFVAAYEARERYTFDNIFRNFFRYRTCSNSVTVTRAQVFDLTVGVEVMFDCQSAYKLLNYYKNR